MSKNYFKILTSLQRQLAYKIIGRMKQEIEPTIKLLKRQPSQRTLDDDYLNTLDYIRKRYKFYVDLLKKFVDLSTNTYKSLGKRTRNIVASSILSSILAASTGAMIARHEAVEESGFTSHLRFMPFEDIETDEENRLERAITHHDYLELLKILALQLFKGINISEKSQPYWIRKLIEDGKLDVGVFIHSDYLHSPLSSVRPMTKIIGGKGVKIKIRVARTPQELVEIFKTSELVYIASHSMSSREGRVFGICLDEKIMVMKNIKLWVPEADIKKFELMGVKQYKIIKTVVEDKTGKKWFNIELLPNFFNGLQTIPKFQVIIGWTCSGAQLKEAFERLRERKPTLVILGKRVLYGGPYALFSTIIDAIDKGATIEELVEWLNNVELYGSFHEEFDETKKFKQEPKRTKIGYYSEPFSYTLINANFPPDEENIKNKHYSKRGIYFFLNLIFGNY